jgi:hypothetical protein
MRGKVASTTCRLPFWLRHVAAANARFPVHAPLATPFATPARAATRSARHGARMRRDTTEARDTRIVAATPGSEEYPPQTRAATPGSFALGVTFAHSGPWT